MESSTISHLDPDTFKETLEQLSGMSSIDHPMSSSSTPQASTSQGLRTPTTIIVQLTAQDLQDIMQGMGQNMVNSLTAILPQLQQRAAPQTAGQQQVIASTKDLKFVKQKPFSRKSQDLKDFLNECELYLSIKNDIYDTDAKKIAYALSLFKSGDAELWKKQYITQNIDNNHQLLDTWAEFKD